MWMKSRMFKIDDYICRNVSNEIWLETMPEDLSERLLIFPESEISHRWVLISSGGTGPGFCLRNAISGALNWRHCPEYPRCPKSQSKPEASSQVSLKDLPRDRSGQLQNPQGPASVEKTGRQR